MDQLGFEIDWLDFEGTVVNIPSLWYGKMSHHQEEIEEQG